MNKDEELKAGIDRWLFDNGTTASWEREPMVNSLYQLLHSHVIEARIEQTFRCDRQVRLIDDMDVRHQWFEKETAELQKLKEGK